ncbi:3-isopropylmalate dehydrogenase [Pedomonas mirosovicensis]|uniref:3-isopropylmalate dehydrogenase n=1 Tax=Pedomonas mirosovicensis TaxID=2908641 RepID=UPI00216732C6|nr:3-isopropylmalate dehydrogenase [Pedomonas mirosovicensis]MCH8686085.1 3-isopropylmalate dehydrogenase [Pedomonas mirosovicensis]
MTKSLLILPGDGIGPEVTAEAIKVVNWLREHRGFDVEISQDLLGGASIDATGVPLTDAALDKAKAADAVLMGAVGGPKWVGQPYDKRPEAGLLRLRKDLDLFANLRPAICFPALADSSSLKREFVEGLDLLFVRELTGGVYFGTPRGIENLPNGERRGINTQVYTTSEIHRVARVAFDLAAKRRNKVTSAEKHNVMESGLLWKEEVQKLHDADYASVELEHMLADNCAMQLVKNPKQFDVILTDNLFGDILSDQAAMLTGSLGMLPSASLGAKDAATGKQASLYEPIHGSAPDIAGKGVANPCATILSLAMCLRFSFGRGEDADKLEAAVAQTLADGIRTADIWLDGCTRVGTSEMGDAILERLAA